MALTAIDILVLLAVGGGAMLGVARGFVQEAMSLIAWIAAILAVKFLHDPVTSILIGPVGTASGAAVLAFAIVFAVIFLVVRAAGTALGKSTRASLLGPVDRFLGFAFGAFKGLVIASAAFMFFILVYDTVWGGKSDRPAWMTDSRTYPLLRATSEAMIDFIAKRRAE